MKTYCYELIYRWIGYLYNDGFVVVEIEDDGRIHSIEGLLGIDYLNTKIVNNKIDFFVYEYDYKTRKYIKDFNGVVRINSLELPFSFVFTQKDEEEEIVVELIATKELEAMPCKERLEKFKAQW